MVQNAVPALSLPTYPFYHLDLWVGLYKFRLTASPQAKSWRQTWGLSIDPRVHMQYCIQFFFTTSRQADQVAMLMTTQCCMKINIAKTNNLWTYFLSHCLQDGLHTVSSRPHIDHHVHACKYIPSKVSYHLLYQPQMGPKGSLQIHIMYVHIIVHCCMPITYI